MVAGGEIDTVLSVFPDMPGRLMGKRLTGRFFVDHVCVRMGRTRAHICWARMLEMNTLPGFAMTSWRTGYHDFKVQPDMATLRPAPWLEKTAIVLGDVLTDAGEAVERRRARSCGRQIQRLARAWG